EANGLFRPKHVLECAASRQLMGPPLPHELGVGRRDVEFCRGAKRAVLIVEHHAELCFADARGILQHASKHRSNSPGELEMTRSTSEVAVCCSSDSLRSRLLACSSVNSRTFSIAITAWSGERAEQIDLTIRKRAGRPAGNRDHADGVPFVDHRYANDGSQPDSTIRLAHGPLH